MNRVAVGWTALFAWMLVACAAAEDDFGRNGAPVGAGGSGGLQPASQGGAFGGAGTMPVAGASGGGGSPGIGTAGMTAPGIGGAGGMTGAAGAAGTAGMMGMPVAGTTGGSIAPVGSCPPPPAGVSATAAMALEIVNAARMPAGSVCATMIPEINMAAQNHCEYYAANAGQQMCIADPHGEVEGCTGFTGASPGARMQAAGYTGRGASEVMAFNNDPARAIAQWINSVWHRLPILDPWTTHLGYGGAERCDTIDFGRGEPGAEDMVVLWPYPGQTGLPTTFHGDREGPEPPEPPTGWPSATPITVYAREMTVTEHVLTVDGDTTPIEHVWLTSADSNFLRSSIMMYANAPFQPMTTYRVKITGTYVGGPLSHEWTFTTGAGNRF